MSKPEQSRERVDRPPEALAEEERRIHTIPDAPSDGLTDGLPLSDTFDDVGTPPTPSDRQAQLDRIEDKLDQLLEALESDR